jgi:hypothetical protein
MVWLVSFLSVNHSRPAREIVFFIDISLLFRKNNRFTGRISLHQHAAPSVFVGTNESMRGCHRVG